MSSDTKHVTPGAAVPAAAPPTKTTTTVPVAIPGRRTLTESDIFELGTAVFYCMAVDRLLDGIMLQMYPKDYALRLARAQEPLVVGDHSVQLGRLNAAGPAVQEFLLWELGSGGAANPRRVHLMAEVISNASGVELDLMESWYSMFGSPSRKARAKNLPVYDPAASKMALRLIATRRKTLGSLVGKVTTSKQAKTLLKPSGAFLASLRLYLPMGTVEVILRDTLKTLIPEELLDMYHDTYREKPEDCTAVQILETLRRGTGIELSDVFHGPGDGKVSKRVWADAAWHLAHTNSRAEAVVLKLGLDSPASAIAGIVQECYGVTDVIVVNSSSGAVAAAPTIKFIDNPGLTPGAAVGQLDKATGPDAKFHSYQAGVTLKLILLWRGVTTTHYAVPDAKWAWKNRQAIQPTLITSKDVFVIDYAEWSRGYDNTSRADLTVSMPLSLDTEYAKGFSAALARYSKGPTGEESVYNDLLGVQDQLVAVKDDAYSRGFIVGWRESEMRGITEKKKEVEASIQFAKDFKAEVVETLPLALNLAGQVEQTWTVKNIGAREWSASDLVVLARDVDHYKYAAEKREFPVPPGKTGKVSVIFTDDGRAVPVPPAMVSYRLAFEAKAAEKLYDVKLAEDVLAFGPSMETKARGPLAAIAADLKSKAAARTATASAVAANLADQVSADAKAAADSAAAVAAAQAAAAAEADKKAQAEKTAAAKVAADQAASDAAKAKAAAEDASKKAAAVLTVAQDAKSKADEDQKKAKATADQAAAVAPPPSLPSPGASGSLEKEEFERLDALLDKFSSELWYTELTGKSQVVETVAQKYVFERAKAAGLDKDALTGHLKKAMIGMPPDDKKTKTRVSAATMKQNIVRFLKASDAKEAVLVDDGYASGEASAKSITTHEAYRGLFEVADEKVPKDKDRRGVALWRYGFMAGAEENLLRQTYPQMRALTYPGAVENKIPGVADDNTAEELFRAWFVNVYKYGEVKPPNKEQKAKKRTGLFQLFETTEGKTPIRLRDDIEPDAAFQIADAIRDAVTKNGLKGSYDGPNDATDEFRQMILQMATRNSFAKRDDVPELQQLVAKMAQELLAIGQKTPKVKMTWSNLASVFKEFHAATKGRA